MAADMHRDLCKSTPVLPAAGESATLCRSKISSLIHCCITAYYMYVCKNSWATIYHSGAVYIVGFYQKCMSAYHVHIKTGPSCMTGNGCYASGVAHQILM